MATKYPGAIDGYQDIRVVADRNSEIIADDHNNLRSAILAIENTLGIDPQGIFGTVVSRLESGDDDYLAHVRGTADRHRDSQIDGYAKVGTYFDISAGTVAEQVTEIVGKLNTNFIYDGSSPSSLPDGYQLPLSSVDAAITQIINQMQHVPMDKALDAFVLEGCAASAGAGVDADVSAGWISSKGVVRKASAQTVTVPTGAGTYYLYAYNSNNAVVFGCAAAASVPFDPDNPIVLIHKIVHNGSSWTAASTYDIRRYGSFVNNKNHFTVGDAPSSGNDGYGCDFTSLTAAFEHIKALEAAAIDDMLISKKIVLASDVVVPSYSSSYTLDGYGWEIDGAGRKLTISSDVPYLTITGNNIRIHDLTIESALASSNTSAALAQLGNCENLIVTNCHMTKSTALCFAKMFSVTGTPTGCIIANNNVEVNQGMVSSGDLTNSIVSNNRIFQKTLTNITSSTYDAIHVGDNCIVEGNYIYGRFYTGIRVSSGYDTIVRNNIIISPYRYGIRDSYSSIGNHIVGDSNVTFAAMLLPSAGENCIVENNYITDWNSIGINANGADAIIKGNLIHGSGSNSRNGIYNVDTGSIISENIISGFGRAGSYPAIDVTGANQLIISNNRVTDCYDIAIDVTGCSECTVIGNSLIGDGINSTEAIKDISYRSIISGNLIYRYGVTTTDVGIQAASQCTINNNIFYLQGGIAIDANLAENAIIEGNYFYGGTGVSSEVIYDLGLGSRVCNNVFKDFGAVAKNVISFGTSGNYITVMGNSFRDCAGNGIFCDDKSYASIVGNVFDGYSESWSAILNVGQFGSVTNNTIASYGANVGSFGITATSDGPTSICENTIVGLGASDNFFASIYVKSGGTMYNICNNNVRLVNNTIVNLNSSSFCIVSNNILMSTGSLTDIGQHIIAGAGAGNIITENAINSAHGDGISVSGNGVLCANNNISQNKGSAISILTGLQGNLVYNNAINACENDSIIIAASSPNHVIKNNLISESTSLTSSINCGGNPTIVEGNIMQASATDYAIYNFGEYSQIVGNYTILYTDIAIYTTAAASSCIISNNLISYPGVGTLSEGIKISATSNNSIVSNNVLGGNGAGESVVAVGIDLGDAPEVSCLGNIIYSSDANASSSAIKTVGDRSIVANNLLHGTNGHGIESNSLSCIITNNVIVMDVSNGTYNGIELGSGAGYTVVNNNQIVTPSNYGINIAFSDGIISNNGIRSSGSHGIVVSGNDNLCNENSIQQTVGNGIVISGARNSCSANYINDPSMSCISVTESTAAIIGNFFNAADVYGIDLAHANASYALISGNSFYNCVQGSIVCSTSGMAFCSIMGNLISESATLTASIDCNSSPGFVISGNVLTGENTSIAIKDFGQLNVISNNQIVLYKTGPIVDGGTSSTNSIISNNLIMPTDSNLTKAISLASGSSYCVILGNIIGNSVYKINNVGIDIYGSGYVNCSNNYIFNEIADNSADSIDNVGSHNVINGNIIFGTNGHAISFDSTTVDHSIVSNNKIFMSKTNGTYVGIRVISDNNVISSNHISNSSGSGITVSTSGERNVILGNMIYNSAADGINCSVELNTINSNYISVPDQDGINVDGYCQCSYNYINEAGRHGINLVDGNTNVVGNYIKDATNSGVYCNVGLSHGNISHNMICDPGSSGIELSSSADKNNVSVIGNNVINSGSYGIFVVDAFRSNIDQNRVLNASTTGIAVSGGLWVSVSGNQITRCTTGVDVSTGSDGYFNVNGNTVSYSSGIGMKLDALSDSIIASNIVGPGQNSTHTMTLGDVSDRNLLITGNFVNGFSSKQGISYSGTYEIKLIGNVCKGGTDPDPASHWNSSYAITAADNIYVS